MSKVLVDRELLERAMYAKDGKELIAANRELRAILDKPAEAEWVVFGFDDRSVKVSQEAYSIFLARERHHLAALSAVTAERDRLQRNLDFTEQWYAERFERLADLGKSAGCWDAMAAIIANGTADPYEPPTYAQQLVRAKHRADVAERERDQLRAEVERLRNELAGKPLVC